jgi:hypothetical protein
MKKLIIGAAGAGLALLSTTPALAASPFNATIAGQQGTGRSPLVNLSQSSTQTIDVANLPTNVGLYALHCVLPTDARQPPTRCDNSPTGLAYLPAVPTDRPSVQVPIRVNAEFYGTNPNPTTGPSDSGPVDCRISSCAVYVLGAGKESANPAYIRVWPTQFLPVSAQRKPDVATVKIGAMTISPANRGRKPVITTTPVPFSVALASGLTPTVSSTDCTISKGTISAISPRGTCHVLITSTGGQNYRPLVTQQVVLVGSMASV